MSQNINQLSASSPPDATLQETLADIYRLAAELSDIYKATFPKMLPTEILQLSHGLNLFSSVVLKQHTSPAKLMELQSTFALDLSQLAAKLSKELAQIGTTVEKKSNESAIPQHKVFSDIAWHENPYFIYVKELYLLCKKYSLQYLKSIEGIDHKTREQLHFYLITFLDLIAPTNYVWSNPEVIESVVNSGGINLIKGLRNYLEDLVLNNGQLNVRMTDIKAFKVGKNLAVTPGKVIFQNDLMQLIQYSATTEQVQAIPILITPPWINKYYVLDLKPQNSILKWLVDQGFTVYIISWVNAGAELAEKTFEDYMVEGPLKALDVITSGKNATQVHMVGYCIGGTLLGCTLAYLKSKKDQRVKSATFFMSLLNFSDPGEIGVFIDEEQIAALDKLMESYGYLNGHLLDMTFNLLRPNDLIWPYFINNYLLGKPGRPFDILYWNADSTNLPYKMYSYYLHNMYVENNLCKPGGITLCDTPINLSEITFPTFCLAAEADHITLWRSIYSGLKFLNAPVEFVLTESGHVRGIINPNPTKYGYRINTKFKSSDDFKAKPHEWLDNAKNHDGSWWPHWKDWLLQHDNNMIPARKISDESVIEDAPGSYVLKRL